MKSIKFIFIIVGLLFAVVSLLKTDIAFAGSGGGTYGKWECEKSAPDQFYCIGIGKGAAKDVEKLTVKAPKTEEKAKARCIWICEKECWTGKDGKRHCVEICRGNGSACDRELQAGIIP